jgi:hypothetical protein
MRRGQQLIHGARNHIRCRQSHNGRAPAIHPDSRNSRRRRKRSRRPTARLLVEHTPCHATAGRYRYCRGMRRQVQTAETIAGSTAGDEWAVTFSCRRLRRGDERHCEAKVVRSGFRLRNDSARSDREIGPRGRAPIVSGFRWIRSYQCRPCDHRLRTTRIRS